MQGSVAQLREIVADMETTAKQALGEDKGGLFGIGAKKPSQAESSKKMRQRFVVDAFRPHKMRQRVFVDALFLA